MAEIYFTDEHEYIRIEDDGSGTVGITDYAQGQLGDVVFVDLPEMGKSLNKGDEAAVIESVKAASEIYAPVTGEVVAINGELADSPGSVNEDAQGKGWFMKISISDKSELDGLMNEQAYKTFVEGL